MDKLIELGIQKRNGDIDLSWNEIGDMFNKTGEQCRCIVKQFLYKQGQIDGEYKKDITKILFISDQHYPFNITHEVLSDYVGKIDILIFGGDETDAQSLSKFRKKYRIPFIDEMIGARKMIIDTIEYIKPKEVYFIKGNHNVRLINYLSDKISDDLLQLMPETNLDLIVNNGFFKYDHQNKSKIYYDSLIEIYKNKRIKIVYNSDWWLQIGDVIFSHPKAYKTNILQTTEKAFTYFNQLGLRFQCLVTAHTHASALTRYGECIFYESGCLCESPEYNHDGSLSKPQSQGFVYLILDNNKFDYNKSKLVLIQNTKV